MAPAPTETSPAVSLWARKPVAEPELADVALWAVARLLPPETQSSEVAFLARRTAGLPARPAEVRRALRDQLELPAARDRALVGLARELRLDGLETVAAALCLAVEEDPSVGRALAYAQAPVAGSRPSLGLLDEALGVLAETGDGIGVQAGEVARTLAGGAGVRNGVLILEGGDAPLPEQMARMPLGLVYALRNGESCWPGSRTEPVGGWLELPPSTRQAAATRARALTGDADTTLVVRSVSQRERENACAAVAGGLGLVPLFVELSKEGENVPPGLGAVCRVAGRLPAFICDGAPGERAVIPPLAGYAGPVLVATGPDGAVESSRGTVLSWDLPIPTVGERRRLWRRYLGSSRLAREVAGEHVHGADRIDVLGRIASQEAALRGAKRVGREDLRRAAWAGQGGGLSSLAQPVTAEVPDEALVLPGHARRELDLLLQRCRVRERLGDDLGITVRTTYRMGVKALFVGPSGTGKTLAAGWLATRLLLPLYRVDLAAVTSKYIGETEKNLATLLARAEQSEVVLLFDEADSLFGKRTEVREANDRFANAQTNYLLQRIESYRGIVVLTSNSRARFDSSFSRRIDLVVEFPLPGPEERRDLWLSHLGKQHDLSAVQVNCLAAGADVAGGHIRSAVLTAAALARAETGPVTYAGVLRGLAVEYRKLGRKLPTELVPVEEEKTP